MKFLSVVDMTGQKIINLGDPSVGTDAVTLQYLQGLLNGLAWKTPVRAASTGNVTLATPGTTLDGVTLVSGDRVLLKDQTTASQNGVYVWTGSAAALTRATDTDSTAELRNATVMVSEGTTNADRSYTQTTEVTTVNTTAQTWVVQNNGQSLTAGNGISISGGIVSAVVEAGKGVTVGASGLALDTAYVVRKFAANIGTGAATSIAITHNLGTRDITWGVYNLSDNTDFFVDAVRTDVNTLTLTFATAPAANAHRVVVHA